MRQDTSAAAWHLAVLDGADNAENRGKPVLVSVDYQASAASDSVVIAAASNQACWELQLGMVQPPHVFRTLFGPVNGRPIAGDFNGDGFDEVAAFVDGSWYVDLSGNGEWGRGDLSAKLGAGGDQPVVGDWNQDGKSDIGVFTADDALSYAASVAEPGLAHPLNRTLGKFKNIGVANVSNDDTTEALLFTERGGLSRRRVTHVFRFGDTACTPVVGDWQGTGVATIGVFRDGIWRLDLNGDGSLSDADGTVQLGEPGDRPIVGDFNRDGTDDLGIYRRGLWHIDTSGDRRLGVDDLILHLGDENDFPVAGDWDGDGRDQIGIMKAGG